MTEDEIIELGRSKDPLTQKFLSHYIDAFYVSPAKRLHIRQLEVIELLIDDMGKLKDLKKVVSNKDKEEFEDEPEESVSLKLFGNKEIFGQVMDMFKNMGTIMASIKIGEEASEIVKPADQAKAPISSKRKTPPGVATK